MVSRIGSVVVILLLLGWSTNARAQIVLSMDFDSGSLDVANSVINGTEITLEPRRFAGKDDKEWGGYGGDYDWRWVYFKASGVKDQTLTFRLSKQGLLMMTHFDTHRYVYSYDQQTWSFFDSASADTDIYEFSNSAPFTADEVYIAFALPYTLEMTRLHTEQIASSPHVSPTKSADSNLIIGTSAGGTDDLGRTVPQHDIYAYLITDSTATDPKTRIVLMSGNHSDESIGNYLYQGMVDFLLGDAPEAAELRKMAEFYCYPQTNPDGRWAGYFLSNPENPSLNHNRHWDNPEGFTDIQLIEAAMKADTGGSVEYFFDVHNNPTSTLSYFYDYESNANPVFNEKLNTIDPTISVQSALPCPGCADGWALTADGLNATYAFTTEPGALAKKPASHYTKMGESYMLALLATLKETGTTTDAGVQDAAPQADGGITDTGADPTDKSDDDEGCSCVMGSRPAELPLVPLLICCIALFLLARRDL